MGRGRGKGKKQNSIAIRDDPGSGDDEKNPPYRKRGRPQKLVKDEIEEEGEAEKIEEEEDKKSSLANKDVNNLAIAENGRKRKRSLQAKENPDSVKDENSVGTKAGTDNSVKPVGFRQNRSRRKNKPRRAAEVGVECK
ncbi:Bifunctional lysine-specific demethylase and histidyl-hydroxylase [Actinidia chinensis var. chinensis]|uniref:Bifunctional lysine-specific demethylase and histidyl-hydroxylase n=1 Tax=Actinidia chinensis var. chinensis TaxID=1590841 RepID=A0A2R6Q4N5_ACTCC|nr:Bifunctional lysine-specific demethylase and histidyl-hydroxylase [Actinidia chinensis var. chinensis]